MQVPLECARESTYASMVYTHKDRVPTVAVYVHIIDENVLRSQYMKIPETGVFQAQVPHGNLRAVEDVDEMLSQNCVTDIISIVTVRESGGKR